MFSNDFTKECKNNSNEAQYISCEVKNNTKIMVMEQGLYAQLIMICRKDLKFFATDKNKNEAKFKVKGQSSRSQR